MNNRSNFRVKQAPTVGGVIRNSLALLLILAGLCYLHTL